MPDYTIIGFLPSDWDVSPRIPHYTTLSRYVNVLCVDLPLTIFDILFRPGKIWKKRSKFRNRLRQVNENLFIYTPIALMPFGLSYRNDLLQWLNKFFIAFDLKNAINNLGIKKYIFNIGDPHLACMINVLDPLILIYEIVDEWSYSSVKHRRIQKLERKLLDFADIVFATSKILYERKRKYNRNTYFLQNGVDLKFFLNNNQRELPDIESIPHPRIGFAGNINTFLDFEWLDFCAMKHPEWSFVFIGRYLNIRILHQDTGFVRLKRRKNVFMLGSKKYEDLPGYLKKMDVLLIPREIDNVWCQNSNPNKIYQYATTGKPIVSSKFSSVEPFGNAIYIATDKYEFLSQIEKAVVENDTELIDRRMEIARKNDLTLRARDKMEILNAYLARKV